MGKMKMKTQKVRIVVAVAADGSYSAGGHGKGGGHGYEPEMRSWIFDGLSCPNNMDYHYVVVEAEVPLPPEPSVVEGKVVD